MAQSQKRKNTALSSSGPRPSKRQRRPPAVFEQGINPPAHPAPPTPPSTVRRPQRSQDRTPLRDAHNRSRGNAAEASPSPLFEPEASQLATDVYAAEILGEDDDEEEMIDATADDDEQVDNALRAAEAVEGVSEQPAAAVAVAASDSPGVAAAATAAQSSRQQPLESQIEAVVEEPHLHFRWRACWGAMEKNAIAAAACFARNKPMYSVSEDKVWRWAEEVVERQQPRVANIDSLTATLYYSGRQAKGDRCTIALQRRRYVAGEGASLGNWLDLEDQVAEMDKESTQLLSCDFDLVLKEELPAQLQPAPQLTARGVVRARPGIVTAIQEDGLAGVVAVERLASGVAIAIRDRWRCKEERCTNSPFTCWVRRLPGRQIDRFEDHYPVGGDMIARWAAAESRGECTVEEPSDDIRLAIMMARDRSEEKKRRRRKVSPSSSNSSLESLTRAILVGHLAQLRAPQQCQHQATEPVTRRKMRMWVEFDCTRAHLHQHTSNFFQYWLNAMPQHKDEIRRIYKTVFKEGCYDINMLMDVEDGMTLEVWVDYFQQTPAMLSHHRRKVHDWLKDYAGLTDENIRRANKSLNAEEEVEAGDQEPLQEVSGN